MRRRMLLSGVWVAVATAVSGCAAYIEPGPVVYRPYYYDSYYYGPCYQPYYGSTVVVVGRGGYYGGGYGRGGYGGGRRWR